MKEEDLKKNLDNIIIDGVIKEAEQENADFEAAMKKMSDEDFFELIMDHKPVEETQYAHTGATDEAVSDSESQKFYPKRASRKNVRRFVPWITSALAAAACILAIVLPTVHHADAKICDSALMLSQQYMTSSKGNIDIVSASEEEVKNMLPMLEKSYNDCILVDGKFTIYTEDFQECGWDLTLAYLKLHKKSKAVEVLKILSRQYQGTPFGDHCDYLLKQLD